MYQVELKNAYSENLAINDHKKIVWLADNKDMIYVKQKQVVILFTRKMKEDFDVFFLTAAFFIFRKEW